jgi:hypothetical protein
MPLRASTQGLPFIKINPDRIRTNHRIVSGAPKYDFAGAIIPMATSRVCLREASFHLRNDRRSHEFGSPVRQIGRCGIGLDLNP